MASRIRAPPHEDRMVCRIQLQHFLLDHLSFLHFREQCYECVQERIEYDFAININKPMTQLPRHRTAY